MKQFYARNSGKMIMVDDEDYERVLAAPTKRSKWGLCTHNHVRARCVINGVAKDVLLHRFLLNFPDSFVDHIDRNPLNNTKANLRVCTIYSPNQRNRGKHIIGHSKYKGVCPNTAGNFRAFIYVNYKQIYLGTFKTQAEAATAYNEAATKHHGSYASLNII